MPAAAPQPVVLQLSHAKSWHLAGPGGGLCGSHLLTTQAHDVDSKQRHDMSPPSPRWSRKHSASKIYQKSCSPRLQLRGPPQLSLCHRTRRTRTGRGVGRRTR